MFKKSVSQNLIASGLALATVFGGVGMAEARPGGGGVSIGGGGRSSFGISVRPAPAPSPSISRASPPPPPPPPAAPAKVVPPPSLSPAPAPLVKPAPASPPQSLIGGAGGGNGGGRLPPGGRGAGDRDDGAYGGRSVPSRRYRCAWLCIADACQFAVPVLLSMVDHVVSDARNGTVRVRYSCDRRGGDSWLYV